MLNNLLQRVGKCVACGERADAFCAACGVTPYCSERCQRRDWQHRHRQVCHNLKRTSAAVSNEREHPEFEPEPASPAPAPLRRPRSPEAARERRNDDSGSDRAPPRKFGPPGNAQADIPRNARGTNRNDQPNNSYDRGDKPNNSYDRGDKPNNSYDRGDKPNNSYERGDRANNSYDRGDRANNDRARNDRANNSYDKPNNSYDRGERSNNNDRSKNHDRGDKSSNERAHNDRSQNYDNRASTSYRTNEGRPNQNGHRNNDRNDDKKENYARKEQECGWNAKPEPRPQASIPLPTIKPKTPLALSAEKTRQPDPKPPAQETPKETLVPKNAVVQLLAADDSVVLTVESAAASGFLCVSVAEKFAVEYMALMDDDFAARQAAGAVCRPKPGELFAYFHQQEQAWYRARCVAPTQAALLDGGKLIELTPEAQCRALHPDDAALPEFSCLLEDAKVQVGVPLKATVISNTDGVATVSLEIAETNAAAGTARLRRWVPRVEPPPAGSATPAASATAAPASKIPSVPRPPVTNNSRVLIVDAPKPSRVFVRPADRERQRQFDDAVQEAALYGVDATPLTELPAVGDTVVAKFEDGIHYRALVCRVSQKNNKCLLEYIEFGNEVATVLDDIYPCPAGMTLAARPALASLVALDMPHDLFTPAAVDYINANKDAELILTIPSGAQTGAAGTAVKLSTERGEDLNRTIEDLCTPEWKKLLARGGDVLDMPVMMYEHLEFVDPPESGVLEILEVFDLRGGHVAGRARGAAHVERALAAERQLVEYCNSPLCKDPYLPKIDEICVIFSPKHQKWVRGMLVEHKNGEVLASALFVDYGSVQHVPVSAVRALPAEFVRAAPAAVYELEIRGFPEEPTADQIERAKRHLQIDETGRGALRYSRAEKTDHGLYAIDAPELIQAMQ